MAALMIEQVLKDKHSADLNSITSLSLSYKALSDVSCLPQFPNLDRLDLASNNLTSLEGLRLCVNLKWLSVVQNKLRSLKGIENLSKLTVLNAGKNKLKSVDEVKSLVSLRALILNDNEIVSICKLNNIKELSTLVLSRNPIREIGESLVEVKSITKLSLSNCQLQTIGSSLKSCIELKELRLAHNDIKTIPAELAYNKKLRTLDLGNNVITTWSDVKVLTSLVDLKNLNLQGNPISEMDKLTKKVIKFLPDLHIFNARPIEKGRKRRDSGNVDDHSHIPVNKLEVPKEKKKKSERENKFSKHEMDTRESVFHDDGSDINMDKDMKNEMKGRLPQKEDVPVYERDGILVEKKLRRKKAHEQDNTKDLNISDKKKKKKTNEELLKKPVQARDVDNDKGEKKTKSKKKREELNELDVIDNGDTSFADFFAGNAVESSEIGGGKKMGGRSSEDKNMNSGQVVVPLKKNKKSRGMESAVQCPAAIEVGNGGASTWDD